MDKIHLVWFGNISQPHPRPLGEKTSLSIRFDVAFSYVGPGSAAALLEISDQSLGYLVVTFLACERCGDLFHLVGFGKTKGYAYQTI
jgi:hypothetical protein